MGIHSVDVMYDFAIISALLLVAKIVRVRVKFIQRLYIPTALIAGFLGLFLGPQFLGILPFSSEISNYAGILIAILFGSMFLGNKKKSSFKDMIASVGDTFLVNGALEIAQYAVFIIIGVTLMPLLFNGINKAFGLMVPSGFVGGHGTAAAVGSVLAANGWEDAISIGQTFATIGLLSGIIIGVIQINIGARRGYTRIINDVHDLPQEMLSGLVDKGNREPVGNVTINAMSLDTITWHLALILVAVGMAYVVNAGLTIVIPEVSFPVYGLALLCSIFIQMILRLFGLNDYVDEQIITHIGSSSTDFLVAFGVASINVSVIKEYWMPVALLAVLGLIFDIAWFWLISPRFFRDYWFERGIYIFGMSTGVLSTGVILLRVTDPEFKSGVLEDFGFAWIFLSIVDILLVSFSPLFVIHGLGLVYGMCLLVVAMAFLLICKIYRRFMNNSISSSDICS